MEKKYVIIGLLWTVLLCFSILIIAEPPQPHNIQGRIFHSDGVTGVENGIPIKINDTISGDIVLTKTSAPPIPPLLGTYSATINGSDGDSITVTAWNRSSYGINDSETLATTTTTINVVLNNTRPPELNVTIIDPLNNSIRNTSTNFTVSVNATLLGGETANCNVTINFSNTNAMNISLDQTLIHSLNSITPGTSILTEWNVTGLREDSSDITVTSVCSNELIFDNENSDIVSNVTIHDTDSPRVKLILPLNNTRVTTNNLTLLYNVTDLTGISNCSLYFDSQLNHTNFDILMAEAPNNFTQGSNASACSGNWVDCQNTFADDISEATADDDDLSMVLYDFDLAIPPLAVIKGIEVIHDSYEPDEIGTVNISLSHNGGSAWTTHIERSLTSSETRYTEGNSSHLWGRDWTPAEVSSDANFRVRFISSEDTNEWFVEYVRVRVYYDVEQAFTINNTAQGNHTWSVACYDNATNPNQGNSTTWIVIVDSLAPVVTLLSPPDNTVSINNTITFQYNVTDNFIVEACTLLIDDAVFAINSTVVENVDQNFTERISAGNHTWGVSCNDTAGGIGISEIRLINVTDPDFKINTSDIEFIPSILVEGDNITINATIHNLGDENGTNVLVQFFENDPAGGGLQIGQNISVNITKVNSTVVSVNYVTSVGIVDIFVQVDPPIATNGSIKERNESNNIANKTLSIPLYHTYFGSVQSDVALDSAANFSVFTWLNESTVSGNIFVTDSDSSISWVNILAISRNITNNFTLNDFAEIDAAMNLTSLDDSVNQTYTINGQAQAVKNFTVFGSNVTNVPIVNSTNTSNFITGILWDTSDLNEGEFNGTQDLIFISNINQNQPGRFGTYDYEIKFPANLRRYIQPNTDNTIAFYTELK